MQRPTDRSKKLVTFLACAVAGILSVIKVSAQLSGGAPLVAGPSEPVHAVIGERLTLSVEVTGAHPLRYCWRKDGKVLGGENGAKLKLKKVLPSSAGEYTLEVANQHGVTVSEPIAVRVCAPSLRIYRQQGIKLTFKARKCVRYTIECKDVLSEEVAWKPFGTVQNRNGTVRLTDHSAPSHLLCVFRLKAEEACRCGGKHHDDDDEGNGGHDDDDDNNGHDDDDDSDNHDDDGGDDGDHGDDDDDDDHGDDDDDE